MNPQTKAAEGLISLRRGALVHVKKFRKILHSVQDILKHPQPIKLNKSYTGEELTEVQDRIRS